MVRRNRSSLRRELSSLRRNLRILEERSSKYGMDAPIGLINEIEDHRTAIQWVEQALAGTLDIAALDGVLEGLALGQRQRIVNVWLLQAPLTALSTWARRNGLALLAFVLLESALLGAYLAFRHRLLIPLWPVLLGTALLPLCAGSASAWLRLGRRGITVRVLALASALLLIALLAGTTARVLRPPRFAPEAFGIAVAHFGEGPDLRPRPEGRQIARDLIEELEAEARDQPALAHLQAREVGIVTSSADARRAGQRIGADLVVWGRFVVGEKKEARVHFEVLETPASAMNPEYPRVLPIGYAYSGEAADAKIRSTHYFGFQETVTSQSTAIIQFVLGLALYLERDYQDALARFIEAGDALSVEGDAELDETAADPGLVHYYLGKSYQMLGRTGKAVVELELAAGLNVDDPAAQLGLAYGYRSLERAEEAQAAARKAIDLCQDILVSDPANQEALYDLGLAYEMTGDHDRAMSAYLRVIEANPDLHIAYVSAGRLYAGENKLDRAIDMYQQAITRSQQSGYTGAWAYVDMGDVYVRRGEMDAALEAYERARDLAPEQDWMHYRLGVFHQSRGEMDLAWAAYERMLDTSANQAWAHGVLASFSRDQAQLDGAIEHFEAAREHNPEDAMLSLYVGETYAERYMTQHGPESDAGKADRAFAEALSLLPEGHSARFYVYAARGRLRFHLGQYDLAVADLKRALEIDPASLAVQFSLARAYDSAGDAENACAAYRKVIEPDMNAPQEWLPGVEERLAALCEH